jgi:SAM-dependent methyltransferase
VKPDSTGGAYWDEVGHHLGDERMLRFWLAHPDVRAYVNEAVSGSPDVWAVEWFGREFRDLLPLDRCAVIGCGTGSLERDLVRRNIARSVTAIDVAPAAVAFAREEAEREGVGEAIRYEVREAAGFLREHPREFDGIFFHGALHHLEPVGEILRLAKASLRAGGILYLDEYVGPSMRQWKWWRLVAANVAYYLAAPRRLRRPRLVRAPRNPEDPSEMIDSASILPAVRREFEVLAERGYGGNLLALVYPNLRHEAARGDELGRVVGRLIRMERAVVRVAGSHHAVVVGRVAEASASDSRP